MKDLIPTEEYAPESIAGATSDTEKLARIHGRRRWTEPESSGLFKASCAPLPRLEYLDSGLVVTGGPDGIAGTWDYAIVRMATMQLAHEEEFREAFRPDAQAGCRVVTLDATLAHEAAYGQQGFTFENPRNTLAAGLRRLVGTRYARPVAGVSGGEPAMTYIDTPLLTGYTLTRDASGRLQSLTVELPDAAFRVALAQDRAGAALPKLLDRILLDSRVEMAVNDCIRELVRPECFRISYKSLYEADQFERCGTSFASFCLNLDKLVALDGLPGYALSREEGRNGRDLAVLVIRYAELPADASN